MRRSQPREAGRLNDRVPAARQATWPRRAIRRAVSRLAADDDPDPPLRGEGGRSVLARPDRRVLPSLHRPGSGRGRHARRAAARRLCRERLPRARPGAGARHDVARRDGRAVREGDRMLEGQGRLDAPVRRIAAFHGRPRHRRRSDPARRRLRLRGEVPEHRPGVAHLHGRGRGEHRLVPRGAQHRRAVEAPRRSSSSRTTATAWARH